MRALFLLSSFKQLTTEILLLWCRRSNCCSRWQSGQYLHGNLRKWSLFIAVQLRESIDLIVKLLVHWNSMLFIGFSTRPKHGKRFTTRCVFQLISVVTEPWAHKGIHKVLHKKNSQKLRSNGPKLNISNSLFSILNTRRSSLR